jgi:glycosyltransferase involved in cell wall biosynthesis
MTETQNRKRRVSVLMPCLNDSKSVEVIASELQIILPDHASTFQIVISDDGSTNEEIQKLRALVEKNNSLHLIEGGYRSGHQSAILRGLHFLEKTAHGDVVIMDSDGEDKPSDVLVLLSALSESSNNVILASRGSRQSGLTFQILYKLFNFPYRILTGDKLRTGNFMAIDESWIKTLIALPSIENHLSATVVRYCPTFKMIRINRGKRYFGKSKMNLASLSLHGYGALAVYADVALSRLVVGVGIFGFTLTFFSASLISLKIFSNSNFFPGWTSNVVLQLFSLSVVTILQAVTSTLIILWSKKNFRQL